MITSLRVFEKQSIVTGGGLATGRNDMQTAASKILCSPGLRVFPSANIAV